MFTLENSNNNANNQKSNDNFKSADSNLSNKIKILLNSDDPESLRSLMKIADKNNYITTSDILPLLKSEKSEIRSIAIELLNNIGLNDVSSLITLLSDNDSNIRKIAVDIMKVIRSFEAEDHLIRLLFDDDINVAIGASEALGNLGSKKAVPHLIQCLSKDPWMKSSAIKSLGDIGDESALNAITSIDINENHVVLFCAIQAIAKIASSKGIDYLIKLMELNNDNLFPHIVYALSNILINTDDFTINSVKQKIDASKLIKLLENDNKTFVGSAIVLSGLFKEDSAVEKLIILFTESNEQLFEKLETAIISIKPKKIEPIVKIIDDPLSTPNIKLAAIRILGKLSNPEVTTILLDKISTFDEDIKIEALKTLAQFKDKRFLDYVHSQFFHVSEIIQIEIIEVMSIFMDKSSITYLLDSSNSQSDMVRSNAAKLLANFNTNKYSDIILEKLKTNNENEMIFALEMMPDILIPEFSQKILPLCKHLDENVRKLAIEKVSYLKDSNSFKEITECLKDYSNIVRRSAIRSLEKFSNFDIAPLILQTSMQDKDIWNRYEAVQIACSLKLKQLLPDFAQMLPNAPDLVKSAIIDMLGQSGDIQYKNNITAYISYENQRVCEAAKDALNLITNEIV